MFCSRGRVSPLPPSAVSVFFFQSTHWKLEVGTSEPGFRDEIVVAIIFFDNECNYLREREDRVCSFGARFQDFTHIAHRRHRRGSQLAGVYSRRLFRPRLILDRSQGRNWIFGTINFAGRHVLLDKVPD